MELVVGPKATERKMQKLWGLPVGFAVGLIDYKVRLTIPSIERYIPSTPFSMKVLVLGYLHFLAL